MKIIYSPHALMRMSERKISKQTVERAILTPNRLERSSTHYHRFLVKKKYVNAFLKQEHLLIVIFEKPRKDTIKIITIIDTSKIQKYLT